MDQQLPRQRSQLFSVRVWQEDLGGGQSEWRGKVQHIVSGEASYFREWSALIAFLTTLCTEEERSQTTWDVSE